MISNTSPFLACSRSVWTSLLLHPFLQKDRHPCTSIQYQKNLNFKAFLVQAFSFSNLLKKVCVLFSFFLMYLFFTYPVSLGSSPAIELLHSPICVFMIHVSNFKANFKIWVRTGKTLTSQLNKRNLQLLFGACFRVCIFLTRPNPSLLPLPMACGPAVTPLRGEGVPCTRTA